MPEIYNEKLQLEKYPGKGGWVYVLLENLPKLPKAKGNWMKVSGSIDGYDFVDVSLWPMPNGKVFMPVKAAIRKVIGKEEGDMVHVVLQGPEQHVAIVENDFLQALADDPLAKGYFEKLSLSQQKTISSYIFEPTEPEQQLERLAAALKSMAMGLRPVGATK